jgi:hypothetical protein
VNVGSDQKEDSGVGSSPAFKRYDARYPAAEEKQTFRSKNETNSDALKSLPLNNRYVHNQVASSGKIETPEDLALMQSTDLPKKEQNLLVEAAPPCKNS